MNADREYFLPAKWSIPLKTSRESVTEVFSLIALGIPLTYYLGEYIATTMMQAWSNVHVVLEAARTCNMDASNLKENWSELIRHLI